MGVILFGAVTWQHEQDIAPETLIEDMVPVDMVGFTKYMTSDLWNHVIYSYIIENYTDIDVSKIQYKVNKYEPSASKQISFLKRIKTISYDFIYKTICSLFGDDNVFILNSYLPEKVLSLLQFKLRQFPINYRSAAFNNCDIKMSERNWGVSGNIQDPFDKALRRVIPLQIPLAYIEGYSRLVKQAYSVKWPKNPKLIFTSNNHYYDDLFKSWAAEKVYSGVPLVIGTHGSGPDFEYSSATIHELSISDYHLGPVVFEKYVHKSILHAHNFTPFIKYDKHGGGLLVELCIPKYSFALSSTPLSCEFIEYLDGQFQFYDFLPFHIRKQFIVRNYHNSYGWDVLDRWMDRYPNVNIDSGATMFRSMVAKSRIVVSSYMGSNYSDLIGSSIPTVSFWNPSLFQVHNGAYDMFSEMKRVGIHHVTPESAAAHISGIWNDVDAWWNSEDVIIVRKQFCSRYAHTAHNLASLISGPFRNILAGQEKCEL